MKQEPCVALVEGPTDSPLWSCTLGDIVNKQAENFGDKDVAVIPWQGVRLSYKQLAERGGLAARALLRAGIRRWDCVGIIAGNRYEYLEVVVGGGLIGCPVLVLNNTYKPWELRNAMEKTSCRILFLASTIGNRSLEEHFQILSDERASLPNLKQIVTFPDPNSHIIPGSHGYDSFLSAPVIGYDWHFQHAVEAVRPSDILSLQFTSGTTGEPKAAMLRHTNILNNARFVGQGINLNPDDIICCPPPLFHCFGLVMGFLATLIHGGTIVFPSDHFDAERVLDAIVQERCTTIYGVPTMFVAELAANKSGKYNITTLRKALAAGSPVSLTLTAKLKQHMGIDSVMIAYGMTETSPVTFMTGFQDSPEKRSKTVGRVMPHTKAKVINKLGEIVRRGERGELCTSGYALQMGYLNNEAKTREVMKIDDEGIMWMHTGDEAIIDLEGYCHITGRIKDIIIRGGENIFPLEIEERLLVHPSIAEASVVGVRDAKYGEVVGCFLKAVENSPKPDKEEIQLWVRTVMGRTRTPEYVFWVGDGGICLDFPKTGSGKHQKHLLRDIANSRCRDCH